MHFHLKMFSWQPDSLTYVRQTTFAPLYPIKFHCKIGLNHIRNSSLFVSCPHPLRPSSQPTVSHKEFYPVAPQPPLWFHYIANVGLAIDVVLFRRQTVVRTLYVEMDDFISRRRVFIIKFSFMLMGIRCHTIWQIEGNLTESENGFIRFFFFHLSLLMLSFHGKDRKWQDVRVREMVSGRKKENIRNVWRKFALYIVFYCNRFTPKVIPDIQGEVDKIFDTNVSLIYSNYLPQTEFVEF